MNLRCGSILESELDCNSSEVDGVLAVLAAGVHHFDLFVVHKVGEVFSFRHFDNRCDLGSCLRTLQMWWKQYNKMSEEV